MNPTIWGQGFLIRFLHYTEVQGWGAVCLKSLHLRRVLTTASGSQRHVEAGHSSVKQLPLPKPHAGFRKIHTHKHHVLLFRK